MRARWVALVVLPLLLCASYAWAQDEEVPAEFDWSVPARFSGPGDVADAPEEQMPGRFDVVLQLGRATCALRGRTVRWTIDGEDVETRRRSECTYVATVPREDVYEVGMEVEHEGETAESSQLVTVEDRLIVSIGDSVASGEGNPDRRTSAGGGPQWEDRRCHRSGRSGMAQAALALERGDERSSVTFVPYACSGATIDKGLLKPYNGVEPDAALGPLDPQVKVLNQLVDAGRDVDAVLVSVGANDVHFSAIVKHCLAYDDCKDVAFDPESPFKKPRGHQTTDKVVKGAIGDLPADYDRLDSAISRRIPRSRIFALEYFDPTRREDGEYCPSAAGGRLSLEELVWADRRVLHRLNDTLAGAAERHGWTFVPGVAREFGHSGYCAGDPDRFVRRIGESIRYQGKLRLNVLKLLSPALSGAFHPNEAGHRATAHIIADELRTALPVPSAGAAAPTGEGEASPGERDRADDEPFDLPDWFFWVLISVVAALLLAFAIASVVLRLRGRDAPDTESWIDRHRSLLLVAAGAGLVATAVAVRETVELAVAIAVPGALAVILALLQSRLEGALRLGARGFEANFRGEALALGLDKAAIARPRRRSRATRQAEDLVEQHRRLLVPVVRLLEQRDWTVRHARIQHGFDAIVERGFTVGIEAVVVESATHLEERLREIAGFEEAVDVILVVLAAEARGLAPPPTARVRFAFVDAQGEVELPRQLG